MVVVGVDDEDDGWLSEGGKCGGGGGTTAFCCQTCKEKVKDVQESWERIKGGKEEQEEQGQVNPLLLGGGNSSYQVEIEKEKKEQELGWPALEGRTEGAGSE